MQFLHLILQARFLPTMADNQFEVYQEAIRKALQAPNENPVAYSKSYPCISLRSYVNYCYGIFWPITKCEMMCNCPRLLIFVVNILQKPWLTNILNILNKFLTIS